MNEKFAHFIGKYSNKRLAVAVSGGVDSVCLLSWMAQLRLDIVCLHVNHGLRSAAATEAEYVQDLCKKYNIPCHVLYWCGDKPKNGIEAAARNARYKLMTDFCHENNIDALVIAHQADDQIETFLLNLSRGSGVTGLAAIRRESYRDGILILRPLLDIKRIQLKKYCDDNGIKYFSDEMNTDEQFARVRMRQRRHVLNDELGISDDRILLAVENLARSRDALDWYVSNMINSVLKNGRAVFDETFLFDVPADIRLKFICTMIQRIGQNPYPPRLQSVLRAVKMLENDCQFTLGHCTLRRLNGNILIVHEGEKTSFRIKNDRKK
ncbi:MAG: tRNA lysidine(34) synthetase TilS [Alphaproteobacteria bacterium]|nr:tRNA lysidine(34) synthetase TilS [Alphaproteobacteria bacterium]